MTKAGRRQVRTGRRPLRRRVAAVASLAALLTALWTISSQAFAQRSLNFLAVDGTLIDGAGPYYFIDEGDSSNAFVKAAPFAAAIGAKVTFLGPENLLRFERGGVRVDVDLAREPAAGLIASSGVVRVDGRSFTRSVPKAILVDGTSYVPVTPLAEAFGGVVTWFPGPRLVDVQMPTVAPPRVDRERQVDATLGQPRIGRHDAYVRIAVDVPEGIDGQLFVGPGSLVLAFPGAAFDTFDARHEAPLLRAYSTFLDGAGALVLQVAHVVDASGVGYRMGRTDGGVLYVDVGPSLRGEPARVLGVTPVAFADLSVGTDATSTTGAASNDGLDVDGTDAGSSPVVSAPPAAPVVVVLDAGHGGHDPGTVSAWAREKEIVLDVTLRLADLLRAEGVQVILTRDEDTFLTLQERSTFATPERNVFVSIHANAEPNGKATGVETWVFGRPLDPSQIDRAIRENGGGEEGAARTAEAAESADIAGDILRESQLNYSLLLAGSVQASLVEATGAPDRGVRQNLFYVIRNSRIPAILVELGFVSHPDEGRKLMDASYRADLAEALADGILAFVDAAGGVAVADR